MFNYTFPAPGVNFLFTVRYCRTVIGTLLLAVTCCLKPQPTTYTKRLLIRTRICVRRAALRFLQDRKGENA